MINGSILANAIRKAYIEPIRTVMLVDDRFRTFADLARCRSASTETVDTKPAEGKYEDERAAALWEACRERGWACDVENGPEFAMAATARISKCDLVVLDFHLVGIDSTYSRQIIRELASSPGSNLVILYTVDPDLNDVRRKIAASLRGARRVECTLAAEELAAWEDLPDDLPTFSSDHIDSFLRGDKEYKRDRALLTQFDKTDFPIDLRLKLLEAGLENYLSSILGAEQVETVREIQMSGKTAPHGWVRQENVFVVFVSKSAQDGEGVFDALESALGDWSPSPLHLTAAYARERIARGGFRLGAKALSDARLRIGLLYHAFEDEPMQGFRHWYERLIESVAEHAIEEVAEFGSGLIDSVLDTSDGRTNLQRARELALVAGDGKPSDAEILEALNEFLCSEPYRRKHVRTGTIFRRADGQGPDSYWVCVTPACDMVPREPREDQWEHGLHPLRPMSALRARSVAVKAALAKATRGRHLFFSDQNTRVAVEVITGDTKQPLNEMMLINDRAVTDSTNCFFAYLIRKDGRIPSFGEKIKMQAVAQLRTQYASRLLQETGSYVSRIGVDFVNLAGSKG